MIRTFLRYSVLLGIGLAGCGQQEPGYAVGTIERYRIDVAADSAEPVIALHVAEGDRVTVGMPLLEQDPSRISIALEQARAEAAVALARLREAEAGPRVQEMDQARAQLASAEAQRVTSEHELARQKSLLSRDYGSESQVNVLQGEVDSARARVEEVRARLAELLEGTRSEQVDQARAALAASRARVAALTLDLERAVVRAPVDGVVESVSYRVGERPAGGQTVVALLSDERTFARVHIPEPLRTRLHPGGLATLRVDGHPQQYEGRIRWISSDAAFTPYYALTQHDRSRLAYLAEIDLVSDVSLPNGVPVEVRFPEAGAGAAP
ncbi:MAG TPA: HlyD family efflux transporter periplasmic adaptor subunit [Pseudomonadales bacterium]